MPRSGIEGHMVAVFSLYGTSILFPVLAVPIYITFVWPPPLPGALALAEELAQASCLPWRGCVRTDPG